MNNKASKLEVVPDGKHRYVLALSPEYGRQRSHLQDDGASTEAVAALEQAVTRSETKLPEGIRGGLIIDMADVDYMNSSAIGSIFSLRKFVRSNGARMVVSRPTPAIRRLLDTVNLPSLIPVTQTLDDARSKLTELNEALNEMERLESSARKSAADGEA